MIDDWLLMIDNDDDDDDNDGRRVLGRQCPTRQPVEKRLQVHRNQIREKKQKSQFPCKDPNELTQGWQVSYFYVNPEKRRDHPL